MKPSLFIGTFPLEYGRCENNDAEVVRAAGAPAVRLAHPDAGRQFEEAVLLLLAAGSVAVPKRPTRRFREEAPSGSSAGLASTATAGSAQGAKESP